MTVPGIRVISPSYGPRSVTGAAAAVLPRLHALVAPFVAVPAASAPPEPDPRTLMADGAQRVEGYLEQRTDLLAVPNQAVYLLDNIPHVDVWYANAAVPTVVSTGLIGDQLTQITAGLSEGEQVVLSSRTPLPTRLPSTTPNPS